MSSELVGAGAAAVAAKQVLDLVKPLGQDVVEMIRTGLRPWAVEIQLRALERTKAILLARGVPLVAARPALREVAPWFDAVAAETDPLLRDMWAGLLASMLDPARQSHPVDLTGVLRQLSPHQAHLLRLVERLEDPSERQGADPAELGAMVGLDADSDKLKAALLHLGALRLVNFDLEEVAGPGPITMHAASSMDGIFLSSLGRELLMACSSDPLPGATYAEDDGAAPGA